jgi:hypothetical protein
LDFADTALGGEEVVPGGRGVEADRGDHSYASDSDSAWFIHGG